MPFKFLPTDLPVGSTIIVAPLDWGLGHAARCIPIIRFLISKNFRVLIAGSGLSLAMLKEEFPNLHFESLTTETINYSKSIPVLLKLFIQLPKFFKNIKIEMKTAAVLHKKHRPALIISDNRYGFFSKSCPSYFITHQISPRLPVYLNCFQSLMPGLHYRLIKPFSKCLIPDFEGRTNLSGNLSHGFSMPANFQFIGPLSGFSLTQNSVQQRNTRHQILIIVSGPEPQRSLFFEKVLAQSKLLNKDVLIVAGQPGGKRTHRFASNTEIVNHLTRAEMQQAVQAAEYIVCRAGYSSIMDLYVLKKKAAIVPTPGQTEQEYLASCLHQKKLFMARKQSRFSLSEIDAAMQKFQPEFFQA